MRIISLLNINIKKLKTHRVKAMFLVLPITILMILTIVITSQVQNFKDAADKSIFGTIESQATLINLLKTVDFNVRGGGPQSFGSNEFCRTNLKYKNN